ncbi:pyruvate carboxylase subunit B [Acidaminococcus sp.]|uniref:pyruvate carboxylase subunit B n=1 Tax=Acidaminococcus sp. TaxID=1872103 RepID=UPI003D7C7517
MNNPNPVKIVETVLRDGHQSICATRMRTSDMLPVLEQLDDCGFYALEAWGGATFDSCLRYLNEDPWERLRTIRKHVKKTKLQMLLRGQNILGYNHYADDVVTEFVKRSVANGIDIIRIFDAFNDTRNLETAMKATKAAGAEAQGTLVYTISPYHKDSDYLRLAHELEDMGADSICIKDMSGLLAPYAAYNLVDTLKKEIKVPINVHSHCTSGMGAMTILKSVEAGADIVDTALSPFAESTSHMCTESLVYTLKGQPRDTGIDGSKLTPIADHFKAVRADLEKTFSLDTKMMVNPQVLSFQIPGGMLSNMRKQLSGMGVTDPAKYEAVLKEMPKVRADLGYPPLVTPSSQIVGTMATMNVLFGRYKMIPKEVKNIVLGRYGKTPGPISEELKKLVITPKNQPITYRPADDIPPQMEKMRSELAAKGYPNASVEDVLSYALFPEVALPFFQKNR